MIFTAEERDRVQERLLARAEADGAIAGAAFTGSQAAGDGDRWSDTDLVLAVRGELTPVLDRWTGWLEIDLTFTPQAGFGPRGPQWRTIFGQPQPLEPFPGPDRGTVTAYYAKGAHLLLDDLTAPLAATLVCAPEEAELCRALAATIDVVT